MTSVKFRVPPNKMNEVQFIETFGGIYEHSPWVAAAVWGQGVDEADADINAFAARMAAVVRAAGHARQRALVEAHPDLAGKAAARGDLTASSSAEQQSAGLDNCSAEEYAEFQACNTAYWEKFGFPFVMAVKNSSSPEILAAFKACLLNNPDQELIRALLEIDKIALIRLMELRTPEGTGEGEKE
ncbi:MAG: 2-oxo-4-hydroxy-4-carboxy-5-ureidoimidazoline decarboxylase [Alphaproteobacteria bacterium]|nr:MAG: 2-oxo-4-hydroxy-4-carboxy-5-ureidoimidazoline decarboxylase [Alphaproteobacteria bacterium]